jgi:hypothetical protein
MLKQFNHASSPRIVQLLKIVTAILVVLYLLNCFTPLRIHYDMLRYFAIKECIEDGCPPNSAAALDYLPFGYTGLLLLLSKLGILRSFFIVLVNCIYLFTALYMVRKMFASFLSPFFFYTLVLLNWTVIKYVAHPLSEIQYLFFSIASLYYFYRYSQERKAILLLPSLVFAGIAFLTRTVGIALVPAILFGLAWEHREQLKIIVRRNKIPLIILLVLVAGIIVFSKQLGLNHYTGVMSTQMKAGLGFKEVIGWHFKEWAELLLNIPFNRLELYLPSSAAGWIFILFGIVFFGWFLYTLFKKKSIPVVVKIYLLAYCFILFNWPFNDPRFWVPVAPLIIAVLMQTGFDMKKPSWIILSLLLLGYVISGIPAVGFMTYTSLNKKVEARTQAKGVYRNEYEIHYYGRPLSDTARHTDHFVVHVLQRYD